MGCVSGLTRKMRSQDLWVELLLRADISPRRQEGRERGKGDGKKREAEGKNREVG